MAVCPRDGAARAAFVTTVYLLAATLACRNAALARPARGLPAALGRVSFQSASLAGPPASVPHHFFDRASLVLTTLESTALLADGATTQRALRRYPGAAYEADPLARPFVSHGWPGEVVAGALVVTADLAIRSVLHRTGHHRLERWPPIVVVAVCATAAIHNAWLLNHIASASHPEGGLRWQFR
jgi:hypothetical protein